MVLPYKHERGFNKFCYLYEQQNQNVWKQRWNQKYEGSATCSSSKHTRLKNWDCFWLDVDLNREQCFSVLFPVWIENLGIKKKHISYHRSEDRIIIHTILNLENLESFLDFLTNPYMHEWHYCMSVSNGFRAFDTETLRVPFFDSPFFAVLVYQHIGISLACQFQKKQVFHMRRITL